MAEEVCEQPDLIVTLDIRGDASFARGPWIQRIVVADDDSCESTGSSSSSSSSSQPQLQSRTSRIPITQLASRLFELPAKRTKVVVCCDTPPDLEEAMRVLGTSWCVVGRVVLSEQQGESEKEVSSDDSDDHSSRTTKQLSIAPIMPSDRASPQAVSIKAIWSTTNMPRDPSALRAWSPSPFLEQNIDGVIAAMTSFRNSLLSSHAANHKATGSNNSTSSRNTLLAVDIGSGSGRDDAFLIEKGFSVVGLDNRRPLLRNTLDICSRAAASAVGRRCASATALETHVTTALPLREEIADLVLCVRFLERALLPSLCRHLRVGGVLMYSHFVDGVQHSTVGTPKKPQHYCMHGELKKMCVESAIRPKNRLASRSRVVATSTQHDDDDDDDNNATAVRSQQAWLKILHNEEATLADGRPVDNLIVMRIA